jgi:hypothetical protein
LLGGEDGQIEAFGRTDQDAGLMEKRLGAGHGGQQPFLHVDDQEAAAFALEQHGKIALKARIPLRIPVQVTASPARGKAAQSGANA